MDILRFLWPLLMVAALIAAGMLIRYQTRGKRRRRKGMKQHPKVRSIS